MTTRGAALPQRHRRYTIGDRGEYSDTLGVGFASHLQGRVIGPAASPAGFFCHVLPEGRLHRALSIGDASERLRDALRPPTSEGWAQRFNADGYVVYSNRGEVICSSVQWFRCGGVEVAITRIVTPTESGRSGVATIAGSTVAKTLITDLPPALERMRQVLDVRDTLLVSAAFVGMRGAFLIGPGDPHCESFGSALDRDLATTPWFRFRNGDEALAALRSTADCLWQAAGYSRLVEPDRRR